ncbi:MAG TPA: 2TM domain-containing protein [Flavobacterium sp.]|nr:2TM domain-containing protein [Flavobacterium sp.]
MENFISDKAKYENAKRKARKIRSFYYNLMCYCIVIPILVFINLMAMPEFQWFWFSMLGWGIGVIVHGMEAFQANPFLSKGWEERKLQQFIKEEEQKQNKLNQ